ncbi:unnamed protein product [Effrenium voratum]|nr:unnamed protein product [Effrenium voratum]
MARIILASLASVARIAWGAASTPLDFSFSQSDTWRLVNDAQVTYGWAIAELRVFSDACQSELSPRLEGSGMPGLPASRAQDGQVITEWRSGCHICEVGEASLSLHFDVEVNVMCLQLYQWGDRDFAATAVRLQRWGEEQAWVDVLRGTGMQGGQWDTLRFVQCAPLAPPNFGSVRLTNNGLFPSEATFTCKGIRPMTGSSTSVCGPDGEWSEGPPACWEAVHFIAAFSLVALLDAVAFVVYYRCFVMQRPAPLSEESMLPQDYLGQWNSDLIGASAEQVAPPSKDRPMEILNHSEPI